MKNLHVYFLCLLCAACHPAFSMQRAKKARTQQDLATTQATQAPILDLPTDLIRYITEFLPTQDTTQFMRTCKTVKNMLQARPHILAPKIAQALTDKIDNPIEFIGQRALQNPTVRICGCTVPTQELIDIATVQQQQSIIEILMSKEVDPIQYVCSQALGKPTVTIYGQEFDTTKLLEQLINRGANPLRMSSTLDTEPIALDDFFATTGTENNDDANTTVPSCNALQAPQAFLHTLNPEDQLDYTDWYNVESDNANFQELLDKLKETYKAHPQAGISLSVWNGTITQERVQALAKYPITALSLTNVTIEGLAILSPLKHLRVISIEVNDNANIPQNFNFLPEELCQLTELRTLNIVTTLGLNTPPLVIPEAIGNLKKLQSLNLYNFEFDASLEHLSRLPQLHILKLISPEFEQFPKSLCNLTNLRILYWGTPIELVEEEDDELQEIIIPEQIANLNKLRGFKICSTINKLVTLPHTIGELKFLNYLALSNCQLANVPQEVGTLANLNTLELPLSNETSLSLETIKPLAQKNTFISLNSPKPHAELTQDFLNFILRVRSDLLPYRDSILLFNKHIKPSPFLVPGAQIPLELITQIPELLDPAITTEKLYLLFNDFDLDSDWVKQWTPDMYFFDAATPVINQLALYKGILNTLANNIIFIEANPCLLIPEASKRYAASIMANKEIINYAIDIINQDSSSIRWQKILDRAEQLKNLLTLLSNTPIGIDCHIFSCKYSPRYNH